MPKSPGALRVATGILVAIALLVATRRAYVLVHPPEQPRFAAGAALDANFARHSELTWAHIVPAALLMLLMPVQFSLRVRLQYPRWHRVAGRISLLLGLGVSITALTMSFAMSIGGTVERAATTVFGVLFLAFLAMGYREIRRGRIAAHREWMIRAFGTVLGIAATRPIVGAFFASRTLEPRQFFGPAFWLGFTITLAAAEWWIRRSRVRVAYAARLPGQ